MTFRPEDYLNRALDMLETAELMLRYDKYNSVINRSYYCVFHCVEALVLSKGHFAKTHNGLKTKFSELFVKPGNFSVELSREYELLFEDRLLADYDMDSRLTNEDAAKALAVAKDFYTFATTYFNQ